MRFLAKAIMMAAWLTLGVAVAQQRASAHCDTVEGPVAKAVQKALASGDLTPVLMWTRKQDEAEVRRTFEHAVAVRKLGADARHLADTFFLETVVRVHRAGEGEPYTGIKPAGTDVGLAVHAADEAIAKGSAEDVVKLLTHAVREGVEERFRGAKNARVLEGKDVDAGRAYVAGYVTFLHYVEGLYDAATAKTPAHGHGSAGPASGHEPAAAPAHGHEAKPAHAH